jgi:ribosomal protein L37E
VKYDLSVIIPARNEVFLRKTIESVLENKRGNTEIIAVLDGAWAEPGIDDHKDVTLIHRAESKGQRASMNEAARLSTAKWIIKLDAHCRVSEGFDVVLMDGAEYDTALVPTMYNLHAFDWACSRCGHRTYQGPKPTVCSKCARQTPHEQVMVWEPRLSRKSEFYRFDKDLIFHYWGSYSKRPEAEGDTVETMSLLGACFFMNRKRYWELGGADERHGSWGQQGVEVALANWLSGGRLATRRGCYFSHLFRTQPGFGFPYPQSQSAVDRARDYSRDLWLNNKWPKQTRPLSWLLERFAPIPSWHDEEGKAQLEAVQAAGERFYAERKMAKPPAPAVHTGRAEGSKGVIYYTDNRLDEGLAESVRKRLTASLNGHSLVSVSLKPLDFGNNLTLGLSRGILTMFRQILAGLAELQTDYAFLCEHDVLYHPSHFEFTPPRRDAYYYNMNVWKVDAETGRALFYRTKQTSGLCADRELLIEHYRKRIAKCEQNAAHLHAQGLPVKNDGFSRRMGFEPGCHVYPRGVDSFPALEWMSEAPNVDIRHGKNLTPSRWNQSEFRNPDACLGWTESDGVDGWGKTLGRFDEFLAEAVR